MKQRLLPATLAVAQHLGALVAQARRERGWTAVELAERVGVSVVTLRKIERGDPSVSLGSALNAAAVLRLPLFGTNSPSEQAGLADAARQRLALLPERIHQRRRVDNDF